MKERLNVNSAPAMYWLVAISLVLVSLALMFANPDQENAAATSVACQHVDAPQDLSGACVNPPEALRSQKVMVEQDATVKPQPKPQLTTGQDTKKFWQRLKSTEALRALKSPPVIHQHWFADKAPAQQLDKSTLKKISETYGFPSSLLYFMSFKESKGRCDVVSHKGAEGCFQFMPETAEQFGLIRDDKDLRIRPLASADTAARYLAWLMVLFYADNADPQNWEQLRHALAAYNAGHRKVHREGKLSVPSFTETLMYVHDIEELTKGRATVVRWGDTLDKLSARTGVDKVALLRANIELKDDESLRANTVVYLPDPTSGMSKVLVTRGMTLSKIQRDTGVSIKELIQANRLERPDSIKVGQLIYVPALSPKKTTAIAQL